MEQLHEAKKMAHAHAQGHSHHHEHEELERLDEHGHEHPLEAADLVRIGFVAVIVALDWFHIWPSFHGYDVVGLVAALIGGYPIYKEAFEAIAERRMTMELSMSIALISALAIGEVFTALVIVLFVLIAEVLEGLTVGRGRKAIEDLLDLLPRDVTVRRANGEQTTNASDLQVGDVVVVKPGSRIPVDGVVVAGLSAVDQSAVTGESLPVEKTAGATVFAGTVNQTGSIEVRTTGIGRDTAFGKIIQAVEEAEHSRAPVQKTADRLSGYLVYFALGAAVLTWLITRDIRSTISVIIVAGACGIAAGTPLAILGAIGQTARRGAIVKGGLYIESLNRIDTVVFDKTGTLTFGTPDVVGVRTAPDATERDVLQAAAIAELRSEHPLGRAIIDKANALFLSIPAPDTFNYAPGRGITCQSNGDTIVVGNRALLEESGIDLREFQPAAEHLSEVLVARGGRFLGSIRIADTVRPEAAEAVRTLREMGLKTVLLTGDAASIAHVVSKSLGIDEVAAELLPTDKVDRIKALAAQGRRVAMVGDGINDAPALAQADVGIAMGTGTDVAQESADVVLLGNDLTKLVDTLRIARRCHRIIMFNFGGTLAVDTVGIVLAAFGLLNPLIAALIHVISELVFILNSARLLPGGRQSAQQGRALALTQA